VSVSKPNIDLALAGANPITDAAVEALELGAAERDLLAAIAVELRSDPAPEPTAPIKRRRRRGSGPAIVVFAALAFAGGSLAATGAWNPFGSEQHNAQQQGQPPRGSGIQPRLAHSQPGLTRQPKGKRPSPTAPGPGAGTEAASPLVSVLPQNVKEPATDAAGAGGPLKVGVADATVRSGGRVGGAQQDDPNEQGNDEPLPPPNPPSSTPLPSEITASCAKETESTAETPATTTCGVRVTGAAGAPTGEVVFEDPSNGQFSPAVCVLSDDGNGVSSSCTVLYSPALPRHEAFAHYGGDGTNASSSTGFSV
jgi:hypothetical protein